MSLRLEMLQVARLAPRLLGESTDLVRGFLSSQLNPEGGFQGRDGRSDLYHTVFGLNGLAALQAEPPVSAVAAYLRSFGDGAGLDFVHLCCLARCWSTLSSASPSKSEHPSPSPLPHGAPARHTNLAPVLNPALDPDLDLHLDLDLTRAPVAPPPRSWANSLVARLEAYRKPDGGFHPSREAPASSAYGSFLAWGAYQDLQVAMPDPGGLARGLEALRTEDGAWGNEPGMRTGSTPAAAAAVHLLRQLDLPIPPSAGAWLLARRHPQGGFLATPNAPLPDLLSTATALHALAGMQQDLSPIRESCLNFVDSLWTNAGGFYGHWADEVLDCEYLFYGLLALGHLSLV